MDEYKPFKVSEQGLKRLDFQGGKADVAFFPFLSSFGFMSAQMEVCIHQKKSF
jgi:hypothetical protein